MRALCIYAIMSDPIEIDHHLEYENHTTLPSMQTNKLQKDARIRWAKTKGILGTVLVHPHPAGLLKE